MTSNNGGRKMVFLFPSEEQYKKFNADEFKGTTVYHHLRY